jgi:hypothetical protein
MNPKGAALKRDKNVLLILKTKNIFFLFGGDALYKILK